MAAGTLDRARECFERRAWEDAFAELSSAELESPLRAEDLERLATAAFLTGRDAEGDAAWTRAHHEWLRLNDPGRAARCAFQLAMGLIDRREFAQGGGWLARARRQIDDAQLDCVEQGYLLLPAALQSLDQGDAASAYTTFGQAGKIADRFGDTDLTSLARLGRGTALIALGEIGEGLASLDEAMVSVMAGEVSPIVSGIVYCAVLEACRGIFDLRRAQEWTEALSRWCGTQPDLVPFRGQCLMHRAEIMQLHGAWADAMEEVLQAQKWASQTPGQAAVGGVVYRRAELHRLRGEFAKAEEAYRQASLRGQIPQPGLALLRLAQGQIDVATAAIRNAVQETQDTPNRCRLLAALVEVAVAAEDLEAARPAADELFEIGSDIGTPYLRAMSAYSQGALMLAEGDARAALGVLRDAWRSWQEIEAPYEAARTRVLMGVACRTLGDSDTAEMELAAARETFMQLGAAPDLARVAALSRKPAATAASGLTGREVEVLRLVAAGKTNREIGVELFISEKTVARHLSNIFTKLGLPTRAAATAYAYQHGLA
jgi:DNA-binding CsgD family transcriptional regulator